MKTSKRAISRRYFFVAFLCGVLLVSLGFALGHLQDEKESRARAELSEVSANKVPAAMKLALFMRAIAALEARLIRLEALGMDLILRYDLDEAEFDLQQNPGIGGQSTLFPLTPVTTVDEIEEDIAKVTSKLRNHELNLLVIKEILADKNRDDLHLRTAPPTEGGWISSRFAKRVSPFRLNWENHEGVDIVAAYGSPIRAFSGGVVSFAGSKGKYGKIVDISHGNGYTTRYAHNSANLVSAGEVVNAGDVIALLGNSGRSTGPHLHFEILRNQRPLNPEPYLRGAKIAPFARR